MTKLKNIKNLKKKIFGIALVVGILVVSIVSSTMAYFTDTDEKTNVFTSGNVDIKFTGNVFDTNSKNAYPGKEIATAATITNVGSEAAYAGIIINFSKVIPEEKVKALFTAPLGGVDFEVAYVATTDTSALYVVYKNAMAGATADTDNATVTFFNNMVIPTSWDNNSSTNTYMTYFDGLNITVKAYATQTAGFTNGAVSALQAAFPNVWGAMTVAP